MLSPLMVVSLIALPTAISHYPAENTINRELALAGLPPLQHAAAICPDIIVANCQDNGPGSLRQAIKDSCDAGTIDLRQLSCTSITLGSELTISFPGLVILGPGSSNLTISGDSHSGVIHHLGSGQLSLYGLTLNQGFVVDAAGGCISSGGSILIDHTIVTNCTAYSTSGDARGGGINTYDLFAIHSEISDNLANGETGAYGGGASVTGNVLILYSSIQRNSAIASIAATSVKGGGIRIFAGPVCSIKNSTVSNNKLKFSSTFVSLGDQIYLAANSSDSCEVENSTIYRSVDLSGQINSDFGAVYLSSVMAAFRNSSVHSFPTAIGSNGKQLFLSSSAIEGDIFHAIASGSNNALTTSIDGLPDSFVGPLKMGPLQFNGGPTQTTLPLYGSPLIGIGVNDAGLTYDQRGPHYPREAAGKVDIGATQYDPIFFDGFDSD